MNGIKQHFNQLIQRLSTQIELMPMVYLPKIRLMLYKNLKDSKPHNAKIAFKNFLTKESLETQSSKMENSK